MSYKGKNNIETYRLESIFRPGTPFLAGVDRWRPHIELHYRSSGLYLIDFWPASNYFEYLGVARRPFEVALAAAEDVFFLLYRASYRDWSDVPFTLRGEPLFDRPSLYLDDGAHAPLKFYFIVVDAASGITRAVRAEKLSDKFHEQAIRAARHDEAVWANDVSRNLTIERLQGRFPTPNTMLQNAVIHEHFPARTTDVSQNGKGNPGELQPPLIIDVDEENSPPA